MRLALTTALTRDAEQRAIAAGSSLARLMDRAGAAVAREAAIVAGEGRVLVLAGPGNNAGDGWVAARLLTEAGRDVLVLSTTDAASLPEPASEAAALAMGAGVPWRLLEDLFGLERELSTSSLVIDALLGVGAHGGLRDPLPAIVAAVNDAGLTVLAVDVPTGVDADTGAVAPSAIRADVTITFGSAKTGLLQFPGASFVGTLTVSDIGLPRPVLEPSAVELWEADDLASAFPWPEPDANKGSRGRVLVVAGSLGMSGAAVLAAAGAQRAGAGYVVLAVPASLVDTVDAGVLSAVTRPLPETSGRALAAEAADEVLRLAARADVVVLGPGLGTAPETAEAVRTIVAACERPLVLDADALNILARAPDVLAARTAPTVITPHPGEAGRLLGSSTGDVQRDRYAAARALTGPGRVVALKGARTVLASTERTAANVTGNPGLATTGTGDVLAGMVGALAASGLELFDSTVLAAYLHGRAGDLAVSDGGPVGLVAGDLPPLIPCAIAELAAVARRAV